MIRHFEQTGSVAGLSQEMGTAHEGTRTAKEAV